MNKVHQAVEDVLGMQFGIIYTQQLGINAAIGVENNIRIADLYT